MRKLQLGIVITLLIVNLLNLTSVLALCNEGQIDINTASAGELEKITHVGPKVAGYIIEKRPFNSIDELVEVRYISEGYLADIKEQGLACINDEEENKNEEVENNSVQDKESDNEGNDNVDEGSDIANNVANYTNSQASILKNISLNIINLNAQTIKTEENIENKSTGKYAFYGLIGFCIVLGILFFAKYKRREKNELQ